jgi:hypothetical protein
MKFAYLEAYIAVLAALIANALSIASEDQKGTLGVRRVGIGSRKAKANECEEGQKDGELHVVDKVVEQLQVQSEWCSPRYPG